MLLVYVIQQFSTWKWKRNVS